MTATNLDHGSVHMRHLAIAEKGKLAALAGDHGRALELYRTALRLAGEMAAPTPFARHYTDCILESLEREGRHADALALTVAACEELERREAVSPLQRRDHATLTLRRAILLLFLGREAEADRQLERAVAIAHPDRLALAAELQAWRRRALTITAQTLAEALSRHGYYTVRRARVRPDLARRAALPPDLSRQEVT
ncbi:hypothetical protein [Halomonas denitrificans]|uniref:hypothetical protein n=1 Tax=Halomonas denitrificans TaxID=370769 RepID=UPI000D3705D6|nr:hypothetical protein [Halomonas denitrificans]